MDSLGVDNLLFINDSSIIGEINMLKAELDSFRPIDKTQENRIMQKFRLDWNYNSNAIEGNSLDYGETVAFLIHGVTAKGKPLKDYLDIKGHNETIDYLLDLIKNKEVLTEKDIRSMHQMLLVEPYESLAQAGDGLSVKKTIRIGEYKRMPNHVKTITGEIHYYASPEDTPILMNELINWYRSAMSDSKLHPLIIAAVFHHRFASIHPFDDGNGRMSRLLMNLILFQYEYPPVIIKNTDKNEYYLTLNQADNGDIEPFINFIGTCLVNSINIYTRGARGESIEEPSDLKKKLTLFKKEVESRRDKIELKKSPEALRRVSDKSILPFINSLTIVLADFKDLFFGYEEYFLTHETREDDTRWYYDSTNIYSKISEITIHNDDEDFKVFSFQFLNFKLADHSFSVEVKISITFGELDYLIYYSFSEANELVRIASTMYSQWMTYSLGRRYYHQDISPEECVKMTNKIGEELYDYIRPIFEHKDFISVPIHEDEIGSLWNSFVETYAGLKAELLTDLINDSSIHFDYQNKVVTIELDADTYNRLTIKGAIKVQSDFYRVLNSRINSSTKVFVDISPVDVF